MMSSLNSLTFKHRPTRYVTRCSASSPILLPARSSSNNRKRPSPTRWPHSLCNRRTKSNIRPAPAAATNSRRNRSRKGRHRGHPLSICPRKFGRNSPRSRCNSSSHCHRHCIHIHSSRSSQPPPFGRYSRHRKSSPCRPPPRASSLRPLAFRHLRRHPSTSIQCPSIRSQTQANRWLMQLPPTHHPHLARPLRQRRNSVCHSCHLAFSHRVRLDQRHAVPHPQFRRAAAPCLLRRWLPARQQRRHRRSSFDSPRRTAYRRSIRRRHRQSLSYRSGRIRVYR